MTDSHEGPAVAPFVGALVLWSLVSVAVLIATAFLLDLTGLKMGFHEGLLTSLVVAGIVFLVSHVWLWWRFIASALDSGADDRMGVRRRLAAACVSGLLIYGVAYVFLFGMPVALRARPALTPAQIIHIRISGPRTAMTYSVEGVPGLSLEAALEAVRRLKSAGARHAELRWDPGITLDDQMVISIPVSELDISVGALEAYE